MNDYPTLEAVAGSVGDTALAAIQLTGAIAFLLGFVFLGLAAKRLLDLGHDRRLGHGPALALGVVGVLCVFLGEWIATLNLTLYATPESLAYSPAKPNWITHVLGTTLLIIKAIGVLGIVRGLHLWRYAGHESPLSLGAVGRGITFVVAGVAAANIVLTSHLVLGTLRLGNPLQ